MARIDELLRTLKETGGSDLHLAAGLEPRIRAKGSISPVPGWAVLSHSELEHMLHEISLEKHWQTFEAERDLDFAYGLPGVARFRANYFWQQNGLGAVFRVIPEKILTLDDLKLPPVVSTLAHLEQGLVLVTGPTGSGKSTSLAAVINAINEQHAKHIVTIEDPIEFVHPNKRCVFSQREVGRHTESFASALRAAIREDANVVLVGEMRDLETISMAITAAEMGVLVFGTLHTNSAIKTIDRLIDVFPAEQQAQVRLSLSESLVAVVSQLLLKTADGKGRCAVNEILIRTPGLANLIREGNNSMIMSLIQGGKAIGMQTMDDALMKLVKEGRVRVEDAWQKATDKTPFERLMNDKPGGALHG
ncbi:MAG: type IV pilus twitching motility protein PilT [Myxococcota bacterium]